MSMVSSSARKTKTTKRHQNKIQYVATNRNAISFFGAFAGVLLSVPLSVAMLSGMVRADVASAAGHLSSQSVALRPADNLSCVAPAGTTSASSSVGSPSSNSPSANTHGSQPGSSSYPSKPGKPSKQFIAKLVGGVFVNNNATIKAGPHSKNTIVQKTTVANTNNVTVNNSNPQTATSGDATVTASGKNNSGNATTGNASNKNDTDITLYVNN